MFEKRLCKSDILSKHAYNVTLPQVFKHFANKSQLPSLSVSDASINSEIIKNCFSYDFKGSRS